MPKHVTTCFPINTQGKRVIKKEMLGCHPLCPSHIRLMPSELGFPGHICGFWVPKFPPFPSWHSWQLSVIWENFKSLSSYLRLGLKSTATEAMPIRRAYPEFCVMDGGWHFFFFLASNLELQQQSPHQQHLKNASINSGYLGVNLDVLLSCLRKARYTPLTSGSLMFEAPHSPSSD